MLTAPGQTLFWVAVMAYYFGAHPVGAIVLGMFCAILVEKYQNDDLF